MNNNYIKVKIEGKNVNNYIKWLISNKIDILNMHIINHQNLEIVIYYKDYNLLSKYSKTYKINIIKKYGKLRLFDMLKNNIIIISSLILAIVFLYILSNIIFSIDIIYNDEKIIKLVSNELTKYNITKYHFKKSNNYIDKVKDKILNDNKEKLEWIEIENIGTKYIVRLVPRKQEQKKEGYEFQSIITKKDAIITSIKAMSGEKVKQVNQYVKKGEVIISGVMSKPDGSVIYTSAKGSVYGEVWYKVNVEYPLYYQEEMVTGKHKKVLALKVLNYQIPLIPYKKYKQFRSKYKVIVENTLMPISIVISELYEVKIKEEIYTIETAIIKATSEARKKLYEKNNNINEIKDVIILEKEVTNNKVKLSLFISVIEDITEIIEVKKELNIEKVEN